MKPSIAIAITLLLASCQPQAPAPTPTTATPASVAAPVATVAQEPVAEAPVLAPPSFDCSKAGDDSEKMVCGDAELSALDRQLAGEFAKAQAKTGADASTLKATQVGWMKGRNECWKADDKRQCVLESYLTRIAELKINSGDIIVPMPIEFACDDNSKPFTVVFYTDMQPEAAVITWGDDQAIAFPKPSASGSRYGRDGLDFWEHQGEAKVDFYGNKLTCKPMNALN
jgi:uncharacterized protein